LVLLGFDSASKEEKKKKECVCVRERETHTHTQRQKSFVAFICCDWIRYCKSNHPSARSGRRTEEEEVSKERKKERKRV